LGGDLTYRREDPREARKKTMGDTSAKKGLGTGEKVDCPQNTIPPRSEGEKRGKNIY